MSRPHGHARVDRRDPRAWGKCDRCQFLFNRDQLDWDYQWSGPRLINTNLVVCDKCSDEPQEQLRVFNIPADPVPVDDPRPERYNISNNPIASIGTNIGNMNKGGGLASAFDSNPNKPFFLSAIKAISTAGLTNTIGKSWAGLNPDNPTQGPMASRFIVNAPYDAKFCASGAVVFAFQGSNVPAAFTTLYTSTTLGTVGEEIDITITPTTGYLFHQFVLTGDGTSSVSVAQLQIYRAA